MKTKGFLLVGLLAVACSSEAITIDFSDGTHGNDVGGRYNGFSTSNLRFHDSTVEGAMPFGFIDGKGAVVDFGVHGSSVARLFFNPGATSFRADVIAQSDAENLCSWSVVGYFENQVVASQAMIFGLADGLVPLSITVTGPMDRVEIYSDRKIGFDTISFDLAPEIIQQNISVPDSGETVVMLSAALLVMVAVHRKLAFPLDPTPPRVPVL